MDDRTARLIQLMQQHQLTDEQVGHLLGRKRMTVRIWRAAGANKVRTIPANELQLLEFKLAKKRKVAA